MEFIPIGVYGRYAGIDGASSCYLLKSQNCNVIIDMGSGALRELYNTINLSEINAVIASHLHYDHICDMLVLQYYLEYNRQFIDLYIPDKPININALFTSQNIRKRAIDGIININGVMIEPIKISHARQSDMDSYAFKIRGDRYNLVYTGDFSNIEEYAEIVKDADIVLADCCVIDSEYNSGLSHCGAGSIARVTPQNTRLILTHITEGNEMRLLDEVKKYREKAEIAKPHSAIEF